MEQKQEMHDVVEMLLSRMRDYPEDFVGDPDGCADIRDVVGNKWRKALRIIGGVVAPHEKEALDIRLEEARRAVYMGAALKVMLSPDEPMEAEDINRKNRITNPSMAITGLSQAQLLPTGISNSSTMLNAAAYINQIEARQQAMEAKLKAYTEQQAIRNTLLGS